MQTADLHIHSFYSDGTMTIPEILKEAHRKNVALLAVSDHDMLEGARELQKLSQESVLYQDIKCIPAVEINTLDLQTNVHVLGYYVDLEDPEFCTFIRKNRNMLDDVSIQLIRKMEKDYDSISLSEFRSYTYDRTKGGFEALHYLLEKGFTSSLRDGFQYYTTYDCPYDCVDFPNVQTAISQVHMVHGTAVMAHPGVTIKTREPEEFERELRRYVDMGFDGVECYYPLHTDWMTEICLRICQEKNLFITAGSDCHGSFGSAAISEMSIPVSKVCLGRK